jgi:hypothetical protein
MALAAFLLLAGGCAADRDDAETANAGVEVAEVGTASPETFALGTEVNALGAVPENAAGEIFPRGGEVYLSVDASGASSDQKIEVRWVDPQGRVLHQAARRAPQGTRHVPFSSGATASWPPGEHRAVVLIDGRRVTEKAFAVR